MKARPVRTMFISSSITTVMLNAIGQATFTARLAFHSINQKRGLMLPVGKLESILESREVEYSPV